MISTLAGPLIGLGGKLIDNLFETEEEKAAAKAKLLQAQQEGRLAEMETRLSAIIAEAQSDDPWTSRARPTFLYVMYAAIALCFVGGVVGIWWPDHIARAAENIAALLGAIPEPMWYLFGTGYLGYSASRSWDKRTRMKGDRHG